MGESPVATLARLDAVPLDGDALLLDPESGALVYVDEIGAAIHGLLSAGWSPEETAAAIARGIGRDERAILSDVTAFAEACRDGGRDIGAPGAGSEAILASGPAIEATVSLLGARIRLSVPRGPAAAELWPLVDGLRGPAGDPAIMATVRTSGDGFDVRVGDVGGPARAGEVAWRLADALAEVLGLRRRPGTLAWHAAAVLGRDGAILLAGAAGSGKSTLAAELAARGRPHLADDVVAICPASGLVWPSPWAISAKSGSWPVLADAYPQLAAAAVWTSLAGKRVKSLRPALRSEAARYPIAAILRVRHRPGRAVECEPWRVGDATLHLAGAFGGLPRSPEALGCIVETVRRAKRLQVTYPSVDALLRACPDVF